MRIAIDLVLAEKEPGGMLSYIRALLEGLAQIDQSNEYFIITSRPKEYSELAARRNMQIYTVRLPFDKGLLIQHQLLLPDILRKLQPSVLHVPAFAAPIGWHGPLVMTIHDLAFIKVPEQSSFYGRLYWQYLLRESARRAQCIISISEQTCEELTTHWGIEPERIHIIHNALRSSLCSYKCTFEEIEAMHCRYGRQYLLHVGRIMPRKNVEVLIQAFDILAGHFADLNLVLTGGMGYSSREVLQQIEVSRFKERIHQVGWVSDKDLASLYSGATALVFPSKHEGFGLPILEAMTFGIPVVASYEAASFEIAGEAVLRTDCSTASTLSSAITQMLTNNNLRNDLIQLGRSQINQFSAKACAEATLLVYQEAYTMSNLPLSSTHADPSEISKFKEDYPYVSVIVPTTRLEQASKTLETISHQRYQGEIETIVVGTCADELSKQWSVTPVNLECPCPPGKARNIGAQFASGDILIFLDDDCIVAEDWVERNISALRRPHIGAVGASIRGKSRSFFARCTDFTNFGYYQHAKYLDGPVASASMSIPRSVFNLVGEFNETMFSGEDIDLCYRIQKRGYRTVYHPDIVVTHDHNRDTLGKLLRYNYSHGLSSGLSTKIQHRQVGLKNRLLFCVRFPPLFLLLLPCIALAATIGIVAINIPENWEVLLQLPFIFMAKLAYEFGIFRQLILPKVKTEYIAEDNLSAQMAKGHKSGTG